MAEEKTPTPEEIKIETQEEDGFLATPKEEEVRAQIVENLGTELAENTELVDKIVKSKLEDMKRFGKVVGQKKGWREKALKKTEVKLTEEAKPEPEKKVTDDKWKERMEFVVSNKDLSKDEVNEVIAYAEGKGITYDEALKSPFVSSAIESLRAKAKAEKETPPPSTRTPKPGEKTEKSKYPSFEDWSSKKKAKSVE